MLIISIFCNIMILKYSNKTPFWVLSDEDKPSKELLESWLNNNLVEGENFGVNYINNTTIEVVCKKNNVKYIQIDDRYYFQSSIKFIAGENTISYLFTLDIFATYFYKFINDFKDGVVSGSYGSLEIDHIYFKNMMKFEEDEIALMETKWIYNEKLKREIRDKKQIFENAENDFVNHNVYYVFSDGNNNTYSCFPKLSNFTTIKWKNHKKYTQLESINESVKLSFLNGTFFNEVKNYQENLYFDMGNTLFIWNKYSKKDIGWRCEFKLPERLIKCFQTDYITGKSFNLDYNVNPNDVKIKLYFALPKHNYLGFVKIIVFNMDKQIAHYGSSIDKTYDYDVMLNDVLNIRLEASQYNSSYKEEEIFISNSYVNLDNLRKLQGWDNRFKGMFYCCNASQIPEYKIYEENGNNYVYFELGENGLETSVELFNFENNYEIIPKYYYSPYESIFTLKKSCLRYYGNDIDVILRSTFSNQSIYFKPLVKIMFLDKFYLFINNKSFNSSEFDKNNMIIEYPYMLPSVSDNYKNYVNNNRNATETSFSIKKQEASLGFLSSLIGIGSKIISGTTSFGSLANNPIFNSKQKGAIQGLVGLGSDILGFKNWIKLQRLQYKQNKLVLSNNLMFSTAYDTANIIFDEYSDNFQYEPWEKLKLNEEDIKFINGFYYLNGVDFYFTQELFKWAERNIYNDKLNNKFITFKLEPMSVKNLMLHNYENYSNYDYEAINFINEILVKGIRIWNEYPKYN